MRQQYKAENYTGTVHLSALFCFAICTAFSAGMTMIAIFCLLILFFSQ